MKKISNLLKYFDDPKMGLVDPGGSWGPNLCLLGGQQGALGDPESWREYIKDNKINEKIKINKLMF